MSIEINNLNPGRPDSLKKQAPAKSTQAPPADTSSPAAEKSGGDNVSLSANAKGLAQIESEIKDLPEVNSAKVEEIKARIANGEYHIDFEKVAQKMLDIES